VAIGDLCTIVGAIFATNGPVTVGSYCFVAHEVVIGGSPWAAPGRWDDASAPIAIGDDVWIGARAVVLAGARIGPGAIVGAGAVVAGEVAPGAIVAGNPATTVGAV
jgi:acetyltransferase-like isoleucine patch superfamily enzyme